MDISLLLTKYFKGRKWQLKGLNYENLKFTDELPPVSLEELLEKNMIHQEEVSNTEYQSLREEEYNKLGLTSNKLIFALWDRFISGDTTEVDAIQAERQKIKDKHPKGNVL